ncbi:MAG: hypothetical protein ACXW00_12070 [Methylobacter sp.]
MKLLIRVGAILALVTIVGCNKDDKQVEAVDPGPLKTQLETLQQAKQVEQQIQGAADQQRQKIEVGTQ